MSVSSFVQLPSQPAAGRVSYVPLGGNGHAAPHSASVVEINLASDASGGTSTLSVQIDPRYTSLVSYVAVSVSAATGAIANRLTIANSVFDQIHNVDPTGYAAVTGATLASKLWYPAPVMCSSDATTAGVLGYCYIQSIIPNVNGETHYLRMRFYNFDKRVRETTPLGLLFQTLPRAGN
jgi:hypothetical protein